MSHACYCGGLYSPHELLPDVPLVPFLGLLVFSVFINDLCRVVRYSICFFFVDGTGMFNGIKFLRGSSLHQSDITCVGAF